MRRRKGLEDYVPLEQLNEAVESKTVWTYRGSYYCMPISGRRLRRLKTALLMLAMLQGGLLFVSGFGNPDGLRRLYVVLPFLIVLFFAGRNLVQAVTFMITPDRMTRRQSENTVIGMALGAKILVIGGALLALAQIIHLMLSRDDNVTDRNALAAMLGLMLSAVLQGWLLRRHRCQTEE